MAEAIGLSLSQWCDAVGLGSSAKACRWFTFDAPGVLGWTLTEAGLREAFTETETAPS